MPARKAVAAPPAQTLAVPVEPDRLLDVNGVRAIIPLSRTRLYELVETNPEFPQPVKVGDRKNYWYEREVRAYVAGLRKREVA